MRAFKITASMMVFVVTGCATVPKIPFAGRAVEVQPTNAKQSPPVKGELIAVGPEQLWVLEDKGIHEVPLGGVREVDVRRHGLDGQKAGLWALAGAIVTGGALAAACSKVSTGCGRVFLGVGATWAVIGGLSAASLQQSSRLPVRPPAWETLRPYARFPQGLPPDLDPAILGARPSPAPSEKAKSDTP
ncbi:MAG: hypothetical protein ACHQNV_03005 [Vicinamibacteria bacterium]